MNRIVNSNGTGQKKASHKLSQVQFFKLCEYLKANAERFIKERPTLPSVAEQASASLGLAASFRVIRKAKEATGVAWKIPKHHGNDGQARAERSKIRRNAMLSIGRALASLYTDCGGTVPIHLSLAISNLERLDGNIEVESEV